MTVLRLSWFKITLIVIFILTCIRFCYLVKVALLHSKVVRPFYSDWRSVRQVEIDYWREINVNTMTPQQIVEYFHWSNASSCKLTHDLGGFMRIEPEGIDGQKAVCLDPEVRPEVNNCLVYSFGISGDWSFDDDMALYGCKVFSFDPSIGIKPHRHSKSVTFYDIGLGGRDHINDRNWNIRTLSSAYEILRPVHGNKTIDYLKIDVEESEWEAFPQIISSGMLEKTRQLTAEFHLPKGKSLQHYRKLAAIVKSIEDAGMIRFDSKYNLWDMDKVPALDNYYGSLDFEIAFYHILPN